MSSYIDVNSSTDTRFPGENTRTDRESGQSLELACEHLIPRVAKSAIPTMNHPTRLGFRGQVDWVASAALVPTPLLGHR
jgi:hypothetical protein